MNPDTEYSFQCRDDLRDPVRKDYGTGHDKGQVEYKERIAKWEAQQSQRAGRAPHFRRFRTSLHQPCALALSPRKVQPEPLAGLLTGAPHQAHMGVRTKIRG
ncbi:MAG: hypothetical protein H7222_02315 [Methylotenera sp.]|nr:hypothetical protein [Oligoflexia bacterium]